MGLSRAQLLTIAVFTGLFLVLYLGCDTKTTENKAVEKSRAQNLELISVERIIQANKNKISTQAKSDLMVLEEKLEHVEEDSLKVSYLKSMASLWYAEGYPLISGHFAEKIANIENSESAWSIMGTTYAIAAKMNKDEFEKKHAVSKSRMALENALSLNSSNLDNTINLALSYVDVPDETNPMKGVLMLIELNKSHPNNPNVLFQLGRLALQTNQLDKAVERLTQVVEIDKNRTDAYCLLAEVFQKKGEKAKSEEAQKNCLINKN